MGNEPGGRMVGTDDTTELWGPNSDLFDIRVSLNAVRFTTLELKVCQFPIFTKK